MLPLLENLKGLPLHVSFIAGQDCLRDEAFANSEALNKAGVSARLQMCPGVPHEFTTKDGL